VPHDHDAPKFFNCWLWARLEYWRRKRAWSRAGKPRGLEPYLCKRPSRRDPRGLDHYLVGRNDPAVDAIRVQSYKPLVETDEPLWLAWKHFLFCGRVADGDTHHGDN
jgi:hypothetical protein